MCLNIVIHQIEINNIDWLPSFFRIEGKLFSTAMHSVTVVVLVLVFLTHFDRNNQGNCKDPKNVTELEANSMSYEHKNEKEASSSFYEKEALSFSESEVSIPIFTGVELMIGTISMLISNIFSFLILNYLGNLALAKDCLLLYLYKDLMKLAICMNCLSEISVALGFTIGGELGASAIVAKILSFMGCHILLLLLIFMNIIGALKLYQRKTNILDPPMPWGDDDSKGIKWIRVIATLVTLILNSTLFGFEIYPTTYYWFSGQEIPSFSKESMAFLIYPIILIALIFTSIITALFGKFYERPVPYPADSDIPRQIDYFHITFCFMLFLMVILGESTFLSSSKAWNLWKINLVIIQVAIPVLTAVKENKLRHYVYNFFNSKLDELFFYQIYLTPTLVCLLMNITLYLVYDVFDV